MMAVVVRCLLDDLRRSADENIPVAWDPVPCALGFRTGQRVPCYGKNLSAARLTTLWEDLAMRPFRLLRIVRLLTFVCCALACAGWCQTTWADQQAAPEENAAAKKEADEEEEQAKKAPAAKEPVRKKKAPLHELPALKPNRLRVPERLLVPEAAAARRLVKKKPAEKKPAKKKQAIKPAVRRPRAPFWSPRQSGLNAGAAYQLENMGRHVHLSPAMRFHLNRSRATTNVPPRTRPTSASAPAASLPGQGAQRYFPGVSRLPTQKPFANLERPPTALERYWPLLLEGRQDPNTGLIIWSLP